MVQRTVYRAAMFDDGERDLGVAGFLVRPVVLSFEWQGWQSPEEKRANVAALHKVAREQGIERILEISTKSPDPLGAVLSPFNLRCWVESAMGLLETSFESLWNGSKLYEGKGPFGTGPFPELYQMAPWESLKDQRNSARVNGLPCGVEVEGRRYPVVAGYDYLYCLVAAPALTGPQWRALESCQGFTEITLAPEASLTCQAGTVALMLALHRRGLLSTALESFERFVTVVTAHEPTRYLPQTRLSGVAHHLDSVVGKAKGAESQPDLFSFS
ncbi:hypothetical protein E3E12_02650 [Formicincola oecophyllae]|uniref:Uncharacterized protein n=1 Tax=Formicincola oecophyllae TaxID=2558361 RepID=A0A4Y6U7Z6_9PROT|nr:hypothetical protein [Formicincola oecophyllae]QDH13284.1 hypothetical protein E3E12_02650 [Formicincola oecophyllae]